MLAVLLAIALQQDQTTFQTGQPFRPSIAIPADAAIVYGFGNHMPERVKSWRDQGYTVQLMTGVAWGEYQDYLYGRFDGKNHVDEAQTDKNGNKISHGGDVYYMSPGPTYGKYLAQGVRKALDVGVNAIYLEEPEFWVASGYEPAFKREWQQYYGEPWQAPDSSCEAQWRASKLKYFLYRRALQQVFDDIQLYNKQHNRHVKCYVATHSLLNYSSWSIVSPESSLAKLNGCDGYIAQVWTGTARTPNYFKGVMKERTFETAYLEYGAMMNVARATGKRMWFLADPVEDDPKHDWGDYKRNYEACVVASLLQPGNPGYEVMPWPERVFEGTYPSAADPNFKTKIPPAYATELQLVDHGLTDISHSKQRKYFASFAVTIGVAVSDTLMFERAGPSPSDPQLSHIYGLALPFLQRGHVSVVQLETAALKDLPNVLLMTYRGMKTLRPEVHQLLAKWVHRGGVLIFVDDDGDPFNAVREWWNTGSNHFKTPRQDLFRKLGVNKQGLSSCGKGYVYWLKKDPSDLAKSKNGADKLMDLVEKTLEKSGRQVGVDFQHEAVCGKYLIKGEGQDQVPMRFDSLIFPAVDLFDPTLQVRDEAHLRGNHFLVKLFGLTDDLQLLALAGKVQSRQESKERLSYTITGIEGTNGIALFRCPRLPSSVFLRGQRVKDTTYDKEHHLLWVRFKNSATPRTLSISL